LGVSVLGVSVLGVSVLGASVLGASVLGASVLGASALQPTIRTATANIFESDGRSFLFGFGMFGNVLDF
jgi:hypothetical protein